MCSRPWSPRTPFPVNYRCNRHDLPIYENNHEDDDDERPLHRQTCRYGTRGRRIAPIYKTYTWFDSFDALGEPLHDDGINIWIMTASIMQYVPMWSGHDDKHDEMQLHRQTRRSGARGFSAEAVLVSIREDFTKEFAELVQELRAERRVPLKRMRVPSSTSAGGASLGCIAMGLRRHLVIDARIHSYVACRLSHDDGAS